MTLGFHRAEVGEPLVVDVIPDTEQLEVVALLEAQERAERLERNRFAVLAAVEDHLGGHAVVVEIAQSGVHV